MEHPLKPPALFGEAKSRSLNHMPVFLSRPPVMDFLLKNTAKVNVDLKSLKSKNVQYNQYTRQYGRFDTPNQSICPSP